MKHWIKPLLKLRAYKTELDPNNKQASLLLGYAGMKRFAWNWALEKVQKKELPPNAMKLHKAWNIWKKENIPWWKEYSKAAPQEAFRDLQQAFSRFFTSLKLKKKVGYPKFKKKHNSKKSFRLTGSVHIEANKIKIPRIGWLRLKEKNYIPVGAIVASVTLSERAGKWFISVLCHTEQKDPKLFKNGIVLGVDLGLKTLAVVSDGQEFKNPKAFKKLEKKLNPLQIISKHSYISDKKLISKGVQIFPKSIVQENTSVGEYTILNTGSIVEHDCIVGNGAHIMPGAVIGGNVNMTKKIIR